MDRYTSKRKPPKGGKETGFCPIFATPSLLYYLRLSLLMQKCLAVCLILEPTTFSQFNVRAGFELNTH